MPDNTSALGGLLGMDPDMLQQLAQQFGPSDADRKMALSQGLMAAGFGLLGGHGIVNALGNAGQGLQQYNQTLQQQNQLRQQGLTQGIAVYNLMRQQAFMQQMAKQLGNNNAQSPAQG